MRVGLESGSNESVGLDMRRKQEDWGTLLFWEKYAETVYAKRERGELPEGHLRTLGCL